MSHMFCALLYNKGEFDPSILKSIINIEPEDDAESFIESPINKKTQIVFYRPPAHMSRAEGFSEGRTWFAEDISIDLQETLARKKSARVYLICYEGISESRYLYKITTNTFEHRYVSDDYCHRQTIDENYKEKVREKKIEVFPEDFGLVEDNEDNFDEEAYQEALKKATAPFCPLVLLENELGVKLSDMIAALHSIDKEGARIWP